MMQHLVHGVSGSLHHSCSGSTPGSGSKFKQFGSSVVVCALGPSESCLSGLGTDLRSEVINTDPARMSLMFSSFIPAPGMLMHSQVFTTDDHICYHQDTFCLDFCKQLLDKFSRPVTQ